MKILVVDDESSIRDALTEALIFYTAHTVEAVASAEQALDVLSANSQDISHIFLDGQLGKGLSGYEVLPTLRAKYPRIEVICIGALAGIQDSNIYAHQSVRVLSKPWQIRELVDAVKERALVSA